ncbi:D-glycero-beta-D-manno-heptose 1,7-bisphosphate 7-phosphatase [Marinobacter zhejiangensis]|uniref:D,D-heptose 1,7-bisphosphate phosphatase n=1 Tax=Marinobacter zhejiangensis TaxID=488535 RepID=A0A1I4SCK0_9GAMM|nr:D-glycero-beta-D-manno-heptose 1,7-bisphosphate 7-phosphatase [Marinobacter zhejiangensis]SFM62199.1 D-alpha,beta-D-heptose 1,7-bisphosphate phosphatase [Marinobacter zhejiangensis]
MSKKAVFLDRDGVINVDHGYVHKPDDFEFVEGIFDACRHFQSLGYLLIVVTNQSGIARGMYNEQQFQALTEWMTDRFRDEGVTISQVYHCPHHPDYGSEAERHCSCRKPEPGMILQGLKEFDLDPAQCIMIGDKRGDMEAAEAAGLGRKILVKSGQSLKAADHELADEVWQSAGEAVHTTRF